MTLAQHIDREIDILAVFAHPDDEVLCAAGTLALCTQAGGRVTLVCATRGELGPIADPALTTSETLAAVREEELQASCAALGVDDLRFLDLPDAGVDWAAEAAGTLATLVDWIRRGRPGVIITFGPDGLYGHSDHVAIGELVGRARTAAGDAGAFQEQLQHTRIYREARLFYPIMTADTVTQLLAAAREAGLPANLWTLGPEHFLVPPEAITARIDVSAVLDRKLAALRCHRTQLESNNVLAHLTPELAARFFAVEAYRCADGRAGAPV